MARMLGRFRRAPEPETQPAPAEPPRCPKCGGKVAYDLACHTYGSDEGGWFACMPCDSAVEYLCTEWLRDDPPEPCCGWRYTHGLNPRNPRAAANEARRPPWLPMGAPGPVDYRVPGVWMLGQDGDG